MMSPLSHASLAAEYGFNFDEILDRRASDSVKWNMDWIADDMLSMFLADQDFRSSPAIIEALQLRAAQGTFGYSLPDPALKPAIAAWLQHEQDWAVAPEQIIMQSGVNSAYEMACQMLLTAGDGVLVQTPLYGPILAAAARAGRQLQEAPLALVREGTLVRYEVDLDALRAAITPESKLLLLCNPHNPTGEVFSRADLEQIGEICLEHDLILISDEIHAPVLLGGAEHIPIASIAPAISQRTITLQSPSKAFNLPGLACSFAVVQDDDLRAQYEAFQGERLPHVNAFGLAAALAAYRDSADWLAANLAYLTENRDFTYDFLIDCLPQMRLTRPAGTYLQWLDFGWLPLAEGSTPQQFFAEEGRVSLSGGWFGAGDEGFVRLTFATPRAILQDGLERMRAAVERLLAG